MRNKRKQKQPEQHPAVRAVISINKQYVTDPQVNRLIVDTVTTGRFPCMILNDAEFTYVFVKTRWNPDRNVALLMTRDEELSYSIFLAGSELTLPTFDNEDCPVKAEQWQNFDIADWQLFRKLVYTLSSLAFLDLRDKLKGTPQQCLWGGDMKWLHPQLRSILLKKSTEMDTEQADKEFEVFKRITRDTAERYKEETRNE